MPLLIVVSFVLILSQHLVASSDKQELADFANPLIGTDSHYKFSHGNTYPAITMPFGMTAWTPQTGKPGHGWIYTYDANAINGFKATHQPSPWIGDYGDFSIMPMVGDVELDFKKRASLFSHDRELARPYYYRVELDKYNVKVEIAPTTRCSQMRLTFPQSHDSYILIDGHKGGSYIKILPEEKKIIGYSKSNRGGVPDNFACYFVIYTDRPFKSFGSFKGNRKHPNHKEEKGEHVAAYLRFETTKGQTVNLKIGTSFISFEQAERNLKNEIDSDSFEQTRAKGKEIWNDYLNRIHIEGATKDQKITFYSSFYRTLIFPRIWYEPDENGEPYHFSPYDGKVHKGVMYADNGFWDTFRAVYPFFTILFPERDAEIIRGWINAYKEGGWFPKWTSPGYRDCMIGTHVESLIADAFFKGIRDYDVEAAYAAMIKDGTVKSDFGGYGRTGLSYYLDLGYVPSDKIREATARTLEFAYDDFCIAQMAKALGKTNDYEVFRKRAMNYKNVFDPSVGFMRGRRADGTWRPKFDPTEWGGPFTEGSAWHYTWSVMQDVQGLVELMGGREKFIARLDQLFTTPPDFKIGSYGRVIHEMTEMVACNMGQYAHGNEPVHHVLYLYDYVGQPYKTQKWVRRVLDTLYGPGPDGYCGDEDNGQMSAWYLFSAMGFYPVCPGEPFYAIGSPLFKKIVLRLSNGKLFTIKARDNNKENIYIQSVKLNGNKHSKTYITHQALISGGHLEFRMGKEPNTEWGNKPEDAPFSMSTSKN